jgi:hypothetical protein
MRQLGTLCVVARCRAYLGNTEFNDEIPFAPVWRG